MITYTESYTDYAGNKRTEEFHFHYNQAELMEMELETEGGFSARVNRIINANSHPELYRLIKQFILGAYGVKSEDGRRFMKSDDIRRGFEESPVYELLMMRMTTGPNAADEAAKFINGITPETMPKPMAVQGAN